MVGGGDGGEGGKVRIHKFFPFHELNMPHWEPGMGHPPGFIDRYHDVGKVGYDEDMAVGEGGGTKLSPTKRMASSHGPSRQEQARKQAWLLMCIFPDWVRIPECHLYHIKIYSQLTRNSETTSYETRYFHILLF